MQASRESSAEASEGSSVRLLSVSLLGVAAVLVLLALAPVSAGQAFGPRVGHVLAGGRPTFAGIGAALAIGVIVALYLGGGQ